MKYLIKILTFSISLLILLPAYIFSQEEARVTILLTDKEDNPLPNLSFDILNQDGSLKTKAETNDKGQYKSKLEKGKTYTVFFKKEGKEWNFNLQVPDKPGKRAYKYSFKIYIKETSEVAYKSFYDFDEKKDPTLSEVIIQIRDQSGMPLPFQPFTIYTKDGSLRKNLISDSSGNYKITLKKENRYELLSEIENFPFTTYFEIEKNVDYLKFSFDVDFTRIAHTYVDTTFSSKDNKEMKELKTIIQVVNKQGQVEEDAEVILEESNKRVFSGITDEHGKVDTLTDRRKVYEVYVRKKGITFVYEIVLPKDDTIEEYTFIAEVDFTKKPLRKFRLEAYFDTGKWDLRPESMPGLNQLLQMMNDNQKMIIEVEGHTDNRGSEKSNQVLSERRAKSVKNWLTERGTIPSRVSHVGYGELMPCATNKTAQGRQLNRRIEISIMDE
jgi:outer membrane protein OmpA-like peptidoglycan-associated protein